jgi:hypothetical protein
MLVRKSEQLNGLPMTSDAREQEVVEMNNKLPRFQKVTFVLGAAMGTLLFLPCPTHAQSSTTQDRQTVQSSTPQDRQAVQSDDITRRDLARFDQFLDSHREVANQLRKTPSLIDDPQYLQSHPELNTYLQDHPSVKQEISQQPNTFMRLEDSYGRDSSMRDRDAGGQDRVATGQDRVATGQDRDAGGQDRRDVANFNRFLDEHREVAEQVRKDPSLLDNRNFVQNHPALQTYLQNNPGVRDQLRQDPNAFMQQEDAYNRDPNMRDHDPAHDHMADFGGFLHSHSDIQNDLSRDPSVVKDHGYVQNHAELDAYLKANPDVRTDLMANPQGFVQGARQYDNASPSGSSGGAGVSGRGTTGTTGSAGTTGTSTNPATSPHEPTKPNQ